MNVQGTQDKMVYKRTRAIFPKHLGHTYSLENTGESVTHSFFLDSP